MKILLANKFYYHRGGAEVLTRLKELAVRYNIRNQIVFKGTVDRNWVKDYHLLIQPSLIEGFACGLPVIASDLDGPKEICGLLNAGLLVHPNDPIDLSEKIAWVYQSYLSNIIKDNNYILQDKKQMTIFDIQTTAKLYMEHYETDMIKNHPIA
jgi:glycosyltransferase involved in cell wall biosynthesis